MVMARVRVRVRVRVRGLFQRELVCSRGVLSFCPVVKDSRVFYNVLGGSNIFPLWLWLGLGLGLGLGSGLECFRDI